MNVQQAMPAHPQKPVARIAELDLLRFVAATAVVFYHLTYRPLIHGNVDTEAFGMLQSITRFGYLGVTLFFMISGFVILWTSLRRSAGEFVISRIARLYPSFWCCMTCTLIVLAAAGLPDDLSWRVVLANLTMVPGAFNAPYIDGVYWTLFIEWKFYFLIFAILALRSIQRIELWLAIWLAASVACALRFAPHWLISLAMYPYGPYFISGCVFFVMRLKGPTWPRWLMVCISCALGAHYAIVQQPDFTQHRDALSDAIVAATVIALHGLFAVITLRESVPSRLWTWAGSLTYPLYLLHNRIGKALWAHLPDAWSPTVCLLVTLACVFAASAVVAATLERHAYRWMADVLTRKWKNVRTFVLRQSAPT